MTMIGKSIIRIDLNKRPLYSLNDCSRICIYTFVAMIVIGIKQAAQAADVSAVMVGNKDIDEIAATAMTAIKIPNKK